MKQLTREFLINRLYDLWTSRAITYTKFLELKSVKSSIELGKQINDIIEMNK